MHGLSARIKKVAVAERWLLVEVQLYQEKVLPKRFYLNGN